MDIKDIKDLILAIDKTSISKVEIEEKDKKIRIYKNIEHMSTMVDVSQSGMYLYEDKVNDDIKNRQMKQLKEDAEDVENVEDTEEFFIAKSPIVGVYYSAPSPNSEPFVEIGQKIKKGDILCIVEAMKIMNEIEAEIDGEIVEIYAEDEDVIQYGQPLLKLRRI